MAQPSRKFAPEINVARPGLRIGVQDQLIEDRKRELTEWLSKIEDEDEMLIIGKNKSEFL